jgi:hypothetical protein
MDSAMDRQPPHRRGTQHAGSGNRSRWPAEHAVSSSAFVEWDARSDAPVGARPAWPMNRSVPAGRLLSPVERRYLSRLLLVHDIVCRHGVTTAFRLLSGSQILEGIDGCIYFDLHDLAAALSEMPLAAASPPSARVFDDNYRQRYATPDLLDAILKRIATRFHEPPHRPT